MGALNTKQWAEVLTTGSPEYANDKAKREDATESDEDDSTVANDVNHEEDDDQPRPRHRNIKSLDPRSASDDVDRTPIQESKSSMAKDHVDGGDSSVDNSRNEDVDTDTSGQDLLSTPTTAVDKQLNKFKALAIDPRSPSTGVSRTPIVVESPLLGGADDEDDSETPRKPTATKPPKRGVFANNTALTASH